jgi:hypothetical protein
MAAFGGRVYPELSVRIKSLPSGFQWLEVMGYSWTPSQSRISTRVAFSTDTPTITDQIIEALEQGAGEWRLPWHKGKADTFAPTNAVSRKPYRGINVPSLWAAQNPVNAGDGFHLSLP